MTSNTVPLAGATGLLGARIAHHLLDDEDVALRLLTGQTALDDLRNDRYPDIVPVTLARLSAAEAA